MAVLLLAISPFAGAAEILGRKPEYLPQLVGPIPKEEAISQRIWAPGLEQGYVPQGLAVAGAHLYVTGYRAADKPSDALCRVFRIDTRTGKETGSFDLPPECGHSGGVADVGQGLIVVADTQYLWRIDAQKAFAAGRSEGALRGTVKLDRASGRVLARFDTVIGIEGIAFDGAGRLWAVSEAGAKKYLHWKTHFPLVFAIDVAKLQ